MAVTAGMNSIPSQMYADPLHGTFETARSSRTILTSNRPTSPSSSTGCLDWRACLIKLALSQPLSLPPVPA
jgi:hypothetical protein